jgi:uncharacterized integral membrane protein (TIGR00697 family)
MFPQALIDFFAAKQEVLWLTTLMLDLGGTVILYRLFGKAGLQVAIATAIILANLIFFATDVLSENYGKHEAARAVWMGFTVSVIVLVMMSLGLMYLPSTNPKTAAFSQDIQDAFSTILDFSPRFVFGSLLAYLISQRFDVWAFHKIKAWTGERWLWLRNNGSTMASQALDTTIYSLVVWWGTVDLRTALALGGAKYLFKLVIAAIDTIFIYWARSSFLKHHPEKPLTA